MDMKLRVLCGCVYLFLVLLRGTATDLGMTRRNLEVMKHLNRLNKPSLKSIEVSYLWDFRVLCVFVCETMIFLFDYYFLFLKNVEPRW